MSGPNSIGLFVQPNTNNVGIGTTAPRKLLDIQGGDAIVSGNIGVGTTNPRAAIDIVSTGAMIIPSGTTAQIPINPVLGMLRFNTTTGRLQYYTDIGWISVGGLTASGGNTTSDSANYRIHTFTSSGTLNVYSSGTADVLIVAGGGGGGSRHGGGGGAGGLIYLTALLIQPGTYSVVVGGGGAGAGSTPASGSPGQNSQFSTYTAVGGGSGGGAGANGGTGGSGGGGRWWYRWSCHSKSG